MGVTGPHVCDCRITLRLPLVPVGSRARRGTGRAGFGRRTPLRRFAQNRCRTRDCV